ncbi:hypothetical protein UO65_2922 [Actinokineospora spheciospongiae]|uniref:Uncharacterized protein n=1 Tax=Actinokineospora spheciospongiae TaxID=909613 RepID=W7ILG6_9PSEU|nr:hypothetical protein UO65_2922 [Actinokineospora spheciospongiae]
MIDGVGAAEPALSAAAPHPAVAAATRIPVVIKNFRPNV